MITWFNYTAAQWFGSMEMLCAASLLLRLVQKLRIPLSYLLLMQHHVGCCFGLG
jgi:hypothetical protein